MMDESTYQWVKMANNFIFADFDPANVKTVVAEYLWKHSDNRDDIRYAIFHIKRHDMWPQVSQILNEKYGSLDSDVIRIREIADSL